MLLDLGEVGPISNHHINGILETLEFIPNNVKGAKNAVLENRNQINSCNLVSQADGMAHNGPRVTI